MSGELGLAGYRFQYHVIVLAALELWGDHSDSQVDSILVEGRPGADKVDYELIGRGAEHNAVVQVKSRWGRKTWSPQQILDPLLSLSTESTEPVRLELVANGTFSAPAARLVELLHMAPTLDDATLAAQLRQLTLTWSPTVDVLATVRRSSVTIRTHGLAELRDQVRTGLRRLRAASGQGVGDQAAELLRARLLTLAMEKTEAGDIAGRALTRAEFLAAVAAPRQALENALASRWGIPGRLRHREHAVRRDALLAEIGSHLATTDGTHATDGHIRSCVLAGPAGIGKTTLAQQYAVDNAGEFDWIYQLTAHGDDDATNAGDVLGEQLEQFATWLQQRGVPVARLPHPSPTAIRDAVVDALSMCPQSWLLIIDNASTADTIATLVPASGYGTILITTRNSGWSPEQPVIKVGPLTADQARTLVHRRLGHRQVDPQEVEVLCEQLEHLPLSLITATSYLHSTQESIPAFGDTLAQEVHRLDVLDFPLQHAGDYTRTAVAAVRLVLTTLVARNDDITAEAITLLRRASLVFPDRIPAPLVMPDHPRLNTSIAVLAEFSLIERWHDADNRDWLRMHRLIQDVVRADLDIDADRSAGLLREVELATTDLMADCMRGLDLVVGGALRLHAITLAERLRLRGLASWETTTALLANAGLIAHAQGDLLQAEGLVEQALELIPPGNHDSGVAGRRGKTLVTLASLQLERHANQDAAACLIQARDAHDLHRHIRAHGEALVECVARLCQLDAFADPAAMREQFDKLKALPVLTPRTEVVRTACLVNLARDIRWEHGEDDELWVYAERLLELAGSDEAPDPRAAMHAHLRIAEAHGAEGGFDAAWRHYRAAQDLIAQIPGIDPTYGPDEGLELVFGLLATVLDKTTGYPYRDVDRLIRHVLEATQHQVSTIQWGEGQRDWLPIRLACANAMHAAHNGAVERSAQHALEACRLAESHPGPLPDAVTALTAHMPNLAGYAQLQHARRHGLSTEQDLSASPAAPARPQFQPTPCHHFDTAGTKLRPPTQETPSPDQAPSRNDTQATAPLSIDRSRSVTRHGRLVQTLPAEGDPTDAEVDASVRSLASDPQSVMDHLIGAWRIIDTLCHRISRTTGEPVNDLRERNDQNLIGAHHDTGADTVPTRMLLRCLDNDWYPELNDLLLELNLDAFVRMMQDLIHLEYHLAAEVAHLGGDDPSQVITATVDTAIAYDSIQVHRGERTYDPKTGCITVGGDILGEPWTLPLHPADGPGVHNIWILGAEGAGKSGAQRVVTLQAAISGVFYVFPADPRNEHNFPRLWKSLVPVPTCIATTVSDTLENMQFLTTIIQDRTREVGSWPVTRDHPGILLTVDDTDDILAHPRGRALFERIVLEGPPACVGVVAVIRSLTCLERSERLRQKLAHSATVVCFGREEWAAWDQLREHYRTHDLP